MSLIPTVFRSTDPGAPVLSGTAGSFAALMDAVLVDGYGSGVDAKPGLGWIKAFADGHKRAYRNNLAEGGTGMYWRIDDSNAQYVLNSCFHSMSDIDTGVDGFGGGSNAWGKSITANSTAREWVIIGNSRTIFVFLKNGHSSWSPNQWAAYPVGDYKHFRQGYAFNFCIGYTNAATVTAASYGTLLSTATSVALGGGNICAARNDDGSVVSRWLTMAPTLMMGSQEPGALTGATYPSAVTGGAIITRLMLRSMPSPYVWVGVFPGLWAVEHVGVLTVPFAEFVEQPGYPSSHMIAIPSFNGTSRLSMALLDIATAWEY